MPIEPPTDADRERLGQSLRERAALAREHGWELYESTWSSGQISGVRALLDPAAIDAACPGWAPTLWGIAGAEADAANGYEQTRQWFAAVAADSVADVVEHAADLVARRSRRYTVDEVRDRYGIPPTHVTEIEYRGGAVLRITHASGLVHDSDLSYTGADAASIQAARVSRGAVVVQLPDGQHLVPGHELEEHALYGCPGSCGWEPGDSVVIRREDGEDR